MFNEISCISTHAHCVIRWLLLGFGLLIEQYLSIPAGFAPPTSSSPVFWTTWSSGRCPWQEGWNEMVLSSQAII